MPLSDEDLDRYRQTLRRRDAAAHARQEERRERAWHDARWASSVLNEEFIEL